MNAIEVPTVLVASTDDPYIAVERAQAFATAWGSQLHIVGAFGHICSDRKLAYWEDGQKLLKDLLSQI